MSWFSWIPLIERGGVLMIPIPVAGVLRRVEGIAAARAVPCVEDVMISLRDGYELVPLPEGASYLGFMFARAPSAAQAEAGNRAAILTLGGGWGVVTADLCAEYGLQVPELTPEIIARIDELLPEFWSHTNPVDLVGDRDPMVPLKVMEELAAWDGCDAVINLGIVGRKHLFRRIRDCSLNVAPDAPRQLLMEMTRQTEQYEQEYTRHVLGLMEKYGKPVIGVALAQGPEDKTVAEVEGAKYCGVFFPAPEQAVKSLSRMVTYQRWLEAEGAVAGLAVCGTSLARGLLTPTPRQSAGPFYPVERPLDDERPRIAAPARPCRIDQRWRPDIWCGTGNRWEDPSGSGGHRRAGSPTVGRSGRGPERPPGVPWCRGAGDRCTARLGARVRRSARDTSPPPRRRCAGRRRGRGR